MEVAPVLTVSGGHAWKDEKGPRIDQHDTHTQHRAHTHTHTHTHTHEAAAHLAPAGLKRQQRPHAAVHTDLALGVLQRVRV
jgi:hypothetical protein